MAESVLIAGSGIAGLGAALALGGATRPITILDRDPPPPSGSTEQAFYEWERRGATQLRHSHVFLGRLTTLIRERYPELLKELEDAGAKIFGFADGLPPALKNSYRPLPGDEDLSILFSRRTTLELVMRRYAATLPNVTFINDAGVRGMITSRDEAGHVVVEGLKVARNDTVVDMRSSLVIDASGRNTTFPDWLRADGVLVHEEESPAGILYFTRHYKLRDGQSEPERDGTPAAGDLGYIKFGVFNADNRHFSITLAVPEIEQALRLAVVKPAVFDAICADIPGCTRWTEPQRSEPVSIVYAMGNLRSVWRQYSHAGQPQVLNFFAVGDAAVRTNPLYGRGCSSGVVHAHILRATLDATRDPAERAIKFEADTRAAIRPFYDSMVEQDRMAIKRAEHERDPSYVPSRRARMTRSFLEDALGPATRGDIAVLRAFSRAFHMLDDPRGWLKQPGVMARVLSFWALPKSTKLRRGLYPPSFGPKRAAMLAKLNIAA